MCFTTESLQLLQALKLEQNSKQGRVTLLEQQEYKLGCDEALSQEGQPLKI